MHSKGLLEYSSPNLSKTLKSRLIGDGTPLDTSSRVSTSADSENTGGRTGYRNSYPVKRWRGEPRRSGPWTGFDAGSNVRTSALIHEVDGLLTVYEMGKVWLSEPMVVDSEQGSESAERRAVETCCSMASSASEPERLIQLPQTEASPLGPSAQAEHIKNAVPENAPRSLATDCTIAIRAASGNPPGGVSLVQGQVSRWPNSPTCDHDSIILLTCFRFVLLLPLSGLKAAFRTVPASGGRSSVKRGYCDPGPGSNKRAMSTNGSASAVTGFQVSDQQNTCDLLTEVETKPVDTGLRFACHWFKAYPDRYGECAGYGNVNIRTVCRVSYP